MLAQHVGDILICQPIFWLSVSCRGILLPTQFPTCKQELVLVRYVLLLLHACRNLVAIKSLSHSPPFNQWNWFGVIRGSLIALVALGLGTYKTPQLRAKPQSVMTPIRCTDQRERLGDYNISCGASKDSATTSAIFINKGSSADLPEHSWAIKSSSLNRRGNSAPQDEPPLLSTQR
jgi:hypothetical protein